MVVLLLELYCVCVFVDFGGPFGILLGVFPCVWLLGFYGCLLADLFIVWGDIVFVFVCHDCVLVEFCWLLHVFKQGLPN